MMGQKQTNEYIWYHGILLTSGIIRNREEPERNTKQDEIKGSGNVLYENIKERTL